QALGARHIDFVGKGFNAAFWDIFMACLRDSLHESMKSFDSGGDEDIEDSFEKAFAWVIYNMRLGFHDRKKKESEMRTKPVIEDLREQTELALPLPTSE
ncbi:hypothetical protein PENTCL1PPCAC_24370, partial [Pristionchus entomophagus]